MHCLFIPDLEINKSKVLVEGDEYFHIKSLRLKVGEKTILTNGKGLSAIAFLSELKFRECYFECIEFIENMNESKYLIGLALPVLDNKNRFEFAIEKAVELGVTDFYPVQFQYSQKSNINHERIIAKVISALKQCHRSKLPNLHNSIKFDELLLIASQWDKVIVADATGNYPAQLRKSNSLVIVGPEGGFSDNELSNLLKLPNAEKWRISPRILRSETAAIVSLGLVVNSLEE